MAVIRRLALMGALVTAAFALPEVPATAASSPDVWAVVVGIDDYPGTANDLGQAVNDERTVAQALTEYGVPAPHQLVLTDRRADLAHLYGALDWLVANAGPGSTAVFFFAGHVRLLHPGRQAMVTAEGGLMTDLAFASRLSRLRADRAWLVFASCYGGGFDEALRPGRILTAAAAGDSVAYEQSELQHSYLVAYMVERAMLGGRAPDSVESAFSWAADALRREHPRRVPVQADRAPGDTRLGRRSSEARSSRSCAVDLGRLAGCPAE